MSLLSMLDSSCFIMRPSSVTRDASQGVVQVFTVLKTFLACSQQMAGPSTQLLYAQRNANVSTTLYFADDPGTTVDDYLVATDDLTQQQTQYLIQGRALAVPRGQCPWMVPANYIQAPDGPPQVTVPAASLVTDTTATISATIASDGSSTITLRGFVYSINSVEPYPTIGATGVTDAPVSGTTGVMTKNLTGLTASTTYAFRPYVQNGVAFVYGEVAYFITTA